MHHGDSGQRSDSAGDPLRDLKRALEEHESGLLDQLSAEMQRGIPEDATVVEAMAEMKRALYEDPKCRELAIRISTLIFGGEGYLRMALLPGFEPPGAEDLFAAVVGPDSEVVKDELRLLKRIADEVESRLPDGLSEAEQIVRGQDLVSRDPELAGLVAELEKLAESRDGPPIWRRHPPR